jgi:hypothetical protein
MKTTSVRRSILARYSIAFIPFFAFPINAEAQTLMQPPERVSLDSNGVDVTTQEPYFAQTDVSIGPSEALGLARQTIYGTWYGGIGLKNSFMSVWETEYIPAIPTFRNNARATFGNFSESFEWGRATNGMGSTATLETWEGASTYGETPQVRRRDGSRLVFGLELSSIPIPGPPCLPVGFFGMDCFGIAGRRSTRQLTEYIAANGVKWKLHYRNDGTSRTRIQSITSNTGYQLKYYYNYDAVTADPNSVNGWGLVSKIVAINNAIEYCSPTADSCTLTNNWPFAQYSFDASSSYVTDASGRTTRFTFTPSQHAIRTPGNSVDHIVYNIAWISQTGNSYNQTLKVTSASINGINSTYLFTAPGTVVVTNGSGQTHTYVGSPGALTSSRDSLNRNTTYEYYYNYPSARAPRLVAVTSPEGNKTAYE